MANKATCTLDAANLSHLTVVSHGSLGGLGTWVTLGQTWDGPLGLLRSLGTSLAHLGHPEHLDNWVT